MQLPATRGEATPATAPIPVPSQVSLRIKRAADMTLATFGLLALAPLMALLALLIKLDSPGPVLYLNERVGQGGRRFRLCKFRTMHLHACRGERYGADRAEELFAQLIADPAHREEFEHTHKLRCDPRVTRLGRLLRRTALDELPQLMNVLAGHLSIVGPRPVMSYEVLKLEQLAVVERQARHVGRSIPHDDEAPTPPSLRGYWETSWLRPGITGHWQVTAGSTVGYIERMQLDLAYTRGWSLKLDLMIVLRTLGALRRRDTY